MPTDPFVILVILTGAALGACASGLSGFAFTATALGLYAHVLAPEILPPVVVGASLTVQMLILPLIWRRLEWKAAIPFLVGGFIGVPAGIMLLSALSPDTFRFAAGCLLIFYAASVLASGRLPTLTVDSRLADGTVGFSGGVMGGFAGLSGVLPTIWCSTLRWPKTRQRSVFQVFNTAMHVTTMTGYALTGRVTAEVGWILVLAFPALILGGLSGFCALPSHRRQDFHPRPAGSARAVRHHTGRSSILGHAFSLRLH